MPAKFVNDEQLLNAVRSGDESALRDLLARHAPTVFRFAMTMCRNRDDAEDVAQETLLTAVRGAKGVRATASFTTWLYVVARNFCIKMRRRRKHQPSADADPDATLSEPPSHMGTPDEHFGSHELATALEKAIAGLDDKHREVIVLRDVEGLPASDVAAVLGVTVEAVKSRLHRARAEVRARLGELAPVAPRSAPPMESPCSEIGTTFSRYLEGEIGPDACAALQRHVQSCTSCNAVCEDLRRTVALCRQTGTSPLAPDVQARLRTVLENALREAGSTAKRSRSAKS